ncbi:MAG: 1-acyl-sn-glycerol-3-phosphate acyltransferase [Myxococcota bacterium]|nr:1-acyl-sn-glycerol-3-phosphate acyltransferase [Myxococcota bacterium]
MLRAFYYFFFSALWTVVLMPVATLSMLLTWNVGTSIWWARKVWSPGLLKLGGVTLTVEGQENVDPTRPAIYISNHQSAADIPALFMALPVDVRYVAKKQLQYVPFLGWYLLLARYPLVDRGNRTKAIASLKKAAQQIRGGVSIIAYAEGTRSADGSVLPFKKGPFALALEARVPVVPVTIEGAQKLMPKGSWRVHPQAVKVKIGKPIDLSGYGDDERERLAQDVRAVVVRQSLELGGLGASAEPAQLGSGEQARS